jgi:hypothetical protein
MQRDIKRVADLCEICQSTKPNNLRETLMQHVEGAPWQKIGTYLFEIQGRQYLVSIDYLLNFIEVDCLSTTTPSAVIGILKKQFSRFNIPCIIVFYGGPQFSLQEFQNFTKTWQIDHAMSSPNHPQANGKAKSGIKIVLKCLRDPTDQYEALLEQHNIPRQDTPAEMLFGRSTRKLLPNQKLLSQHIRSDIKRKRRKRRETAKQSYDKRAHDLSKLKSGESVFFTKKPN